jgi:UDP-N-acetylmuramoyl-tripeptide--D-alanyl-D-alanine ligase
LRGPKFDGHRFVDAAVAQGAVAAMVDDAGAGLVHSDVPLLIVDDTTRGLGDLATAFRRRVTIPVLAVGGSNGKTTTKDMIAAVLATKFRVLRTNANLNNQIGVPLTLLRLTGEHEIAVIEVGTNHPGEVPYLTSVVQPTHGVLRIPGGRGRGGDCALAQSGEGPPRCPGEYG